MPLRGEVLDALLAAGATAEQIVAAVKADAAIDEAARQERRNKDAERQRNHRSKRKSRNVTVTPRDGCDTPNDIYSKPQPYLDCSNEQSAPLHVRVVETWQAGPAKAGARAARAMDSTRQRQLADRVRDFGEPAVFEAIANTAASKFHCGENDRGWRISLGWMLESKKNFLKMLELGGGEKSAGPKLSPEQQAEELERRAAFYVSIDRDGEAEDCRRRAALLRKPTGPPGQAVGSVANRVLRSVGGGNG